MRRRICSTCTNTTYNCCGRCFACLGSLPGAAKLDEGEAQSQPTAAGRTNRRRGLERDDGESDRLPASEPRAVRHGKGLRARVSGRNY